jgi:phosphomannomutase
MPKHVFFDLDNTLAPSRRLLKPEHQPLFERLCGESDVIVVTGGTEEHIVAQLGPSLGRYFILGQSGNHSIDKDGTELWRDALSQDQKAACVACIEVLKRGFSVSVADENDLIDDRGAQMSYSVIGFHETPLKKDAFDPDFSKRKAMLARFPEELEKLRRVGIEIFPAGSSGFNLTMIGKDKGVNVGRLCDLKKWKRAESLYVGDALGLGENDASVIGVVPTQAVKDPDATFRFIKESLLS